MNAQLLDITRGTDKRQATSASLWKKSQDATQITTYQTEIFKTFNHFILSETAIFQHTKTPTFHKKIGN